MDTCKTTSHAQAKGPGVTFGNVPNMSLTPVSENLQKSLVERFLDDMDVDIDNLLTPDVTQVSVFMKPLCQLSAKNIITMYSCVSLCQI